MRVIRAAVFCTGVALISAGCEVHETRPAPLQAQAGVSSDVAVDEPQGEVVSGPGVQAIDVEPDPAQRVYVYDEGYPPGTYTYDNYYYYGGYRYPRDVFVNRYVQENIRQHKFANKDENRRQAEVIEERHRTEFAKTKGVRPGQPNRQANQSREQSQKPTPEAQHPENRPGVNEQHPNGEKPENRTPANEPNAKVEHPANGPAVDPRPNGERPENRAPANEPNVKVERPANGPAVEPHPNPEKPESRTPANEPRGNVEHPGNGPAANEQNHSAAEPKAGGEAPKQEAPKHEEAK